jgi:DNA-binding response OmpR family regulator
LGGQRQTRGGELSGTGQLWHRLCLGLAELRPERQEGAAVNAKHILVVDDDPLILELIERALVPAHFRVSKARRVSLARDVLMRQPVDLVIADARIPGETGLALAETVRALGIAVIIMTGDPEWADAHGLAAGDYLAKPFDLAELMARIQASL